MLDICSAGARAQGRVLDAEPTRLQRGGRSVCNQRLLVVDEGVFLAKHRLFLLYGNVR
ncbi:hypothetical protein [Xanthomonas hortorum]|uniref:hypothetical protein n=1 Tax=Xanthomonas hortorum TaxID=56454 RepID=UPI001F18FE61|nr:hypothetical protein [Xanthomonas hortorum]MCE4359192.1 hypothetical protein [Xanthomonas hortorum pv. taraxaci]